MRYRWVLCGRIRLWRDESRRLSVRLAFKSEWQDAFRIEILRFVHRFSSCAVILRVISNVRLTLTWDFVDICCYQQSNERFRAM